LLGRLFRALGDGAVDFRQEQRERELAARLVKPADEVPASARLFQNEIGTGADFVEEVLNRLGRGERQPFPASKANGPGCTHRRPRTAADRAARPQSRIETNEALPQRFQRFQRKLWSDTLTKHAAPGFQHSKSPLARIMSTEHSTTLPAVRSHGLPRTYVV